MDNCEIAHLGDRHITQSVVKWVINGLESGMERAIPCVCGRGMATEIDDGDIYEIIACDDCENDINNYNNGR